MPGISADPRAASTLEDRPAPRWGNAGARSAVLIALHKPRGNELQCSLSDTRDPVQFAVAIVSLLRGILLLVEDFLRSRRDCIMLFWRLAMTRC